MLFTHYSCSVKVQAYFRFLGRIRCLTTSQRTDESFQTYQPCPQSNRLIGPIDLSPAQLRETEGSKIEDYSIFLL